jgi:hypothetical protein
MTRRKRYSAEFKREALRRANEVGVTDVLVAEELGINARNRTWLLCKPHGCFDPIRPFVSRLCTLYLNK